MKKTIFAAILLIGVSRVASASTTTDQLTISSGGLTATITDAVGIPNLYVTCTGSACGDLFGGDSSPLAGTTGAAGTIGNWTITNLSGTTYSPGVNPTALTLALGATCNGDCTGENALTISYSDINFTTPIAANGFTSGFSDTSNLLGQSVSQQAFFDNTNTIFGQGNDIGGLIQFSNSTTGDTVHGGSTATTAPYSLTLNEVFNGIDGTTVGSNGDIEANLSSVPEPTSVILLSSLAVFVGFALRRKLSGTAV